MVVILYQHGSCLLTCLQLLQDTTITASVVWINNYNRVYKHVHLQKPVRMREDKSDEIE